MDDMPTLTTERRGSSWRFTISIPPDCLQHYPGKKRLLRLTVRGSDKLKAQEEAHRWAADMAAEWRRIRETGSPLKKTITDAEADRLCELAAVSRLGADEEGRDDGRQEWQALKQSQTVSILEELEQAERDAISGRSLGGVAAQALDWLLGHGYDIAPDSQEFRSFARRFAKASQLASCAIRKREEGAWVDTPSVPDMAPSAASSVVPKLSLVISHYLEKQKDKDAPMYRKQESSLALFLEVLGDRPVDTLRQQDIDDFFALLCRLPPRWSDEKRRKGLGAVALADMEWPKCIAPKTFEAGYMAALRPFLLNARRLFGDQGFPRHLTTDGIKYSGIREGGENAQRALRPDELKRLYEGPEFAAFSADPEKEHYYWLLLLGLYTGARVNEICQLNPQKDIREEGGIWFFDITEETETDERVRKSVKNMGSRRRVPIHSRLLGLGFLDYATRMRGAGSVLLFPQWAVWQGKASAGARKWFGGLLRSLGLRDETPGARVAGYHCYRSTFLSRAQHLDIEHAEWITGHAPEGVSSVVRKYRGQAELSKKREIVERLDFAIEIPPLRWSRAESV